LSSCFFVFTQFLSSSFCLHFFSLVFLSFFGSFIHHLAFLFLVHRKAFSIFFSHWRWWFLLLIHDEGRVYEVGFVLSAHCTPFMNSIVILLGAFFSLCINNGNLSFSCNFWVLHFLHLHPHVVFFFSHLLLSCICIPT